MILRIAVAASACVVLATACYDSDITQPPTYSRESPSFIVSSSTQLSIPATNSSTTYGGGTNGYVPVGTISPRKWGRVLVIGSVSLSKNPDLEPCAPEFEPPYADSIADAMGLSNGGFKVLPYRSLGYNVALTPGGGDSTSSAPLFNTSSQYTETITAWRTG
jgi:hypothetical protein